MTQQRQSTRTKKRDKTQRSGNFESPPPVATTVDHGGHHGPWWPLVVVVWNSPAALVFLCDLSYSHAILRFLLCFAFKMSMYLDTWGDSEFTPIHTPFLNSPLVFRVVLERERRSGEELRGIHTGLRPRDSRTRLAEQFLFLLFSFLYLI